MRFIFAALMLLLASAASLARTDAIADRPSVNVPRVSRPPRVDDFLSMAPAPDLHSSLAKISGFRQRDPKDGAPATQPTDAYVGYDAKYLYVIFVCFDDQPQTIRSRVTRRENIGPQDDEVQVYVDTFDDQRRSYGFMTNPTGVQFDYLWTEPKGYDETWDSVWESAGRVTERGWIAWFAIPFKSLRFPSRPQQKWGFLLQRIIPRTSENLFWPYVTTRVQGRLNQEGHITGLENISPGRNLQFIPYGAIRTFRAPDLRDPNIPSYSSARLRGRMGLDSKVVIKDSFVLDTTINPDFSQVESDEPQVTVNQRFEVLFPEKRPFFLENSNYFQTPINLVFTRRIGDPSVGARLTGKKGRYTLATLFADDRGPGFRRPENDPLHDRRALFGVFRGQRDIFKEGSIGFLYTERRFENEYNRMGGFDTRLKFGKTYSLDAQAVTSQSRNLDGVRSAGPMYYAFFARDSRALNFNSLFRDTSPGFLTQTGFFQRPDARRFSNDLWYNFRPGKSWLLFHGPEFFQMHIWDHRGTRLDQDLAAYYRLELPRDSGVSLGRNFRRFRLRPQDYGVLASNIDFGTNNYFIQARTSYLKWFSLFAEWNHGTDINYFPVDNVAPFLGDTENLFFSITFKPMSRLTIDNTYILTRLVDRNTRLAAFNSHVIRSKWNYQFTRSLSLRVIPQFNSLVANPALTSLTTGRSFNADFLITYLAHPGTAVYVGYNSNLAYPDPTYTGVTLPPPYGKRFINDSRQFFVKASWLFRF